jgi:hypothetical protein
MDVSKLSTSLFSSCSLPLQPMNSTHSALNATWPAAENVRTVHQIVLSRTPPPIRSIWQILWPDKLRLGRGPAADEDSLPRGKPPPRMWPLKGQ